MILDLASTFTTQSVILKTSFSLLVEMMKKNVFVRNASSTSSSTCGSALSILIKSMFFHLLQLCVALKHIDDEKALQNSSTNIFYDDNNRNSNGKNIIIEILQSEVEKLLFGARCAARGVLAKFGQTDGDDEIAGKRHRLSSSSPSPSSSSPTTSSLFLFEIISDDDDDDNNDKPRRDGSVIESDLDDDDENDERCCRRRGASNKVKQQRQLLVDIIHVFAFIIQESLDIYQNSIIADEENSGLKSTSATRRKKMNRFQNLHLVVECFQCLSWATSWTNNNVNNKCRNNGNNTHPANRLLSSLITKAILPLAHQIIPLIGYEGNSARMKHLLDFIRCFEGNNNSNCKQHLEVSLYSENAKGNINNNNNNQKQTEEVLFSRSQVEEFLEKEKSKVMNQVRVLTSTLQDLRKRNEMLSNHLKLMTQERIQQQQQHQQKQIGTSSCSCTGPMSSTPSFVPSTPPPPPPPPPPLGQE